ncbi:alkaline phosphatase [Aneurinibacillus aneurinilyticus]|uniref:alkaline phosphatase n=1 Tax=Aneurinibacillus aneurinilyticus TaxID=1391 RepID=UPI00058FAAF7|nr:alkaline phosphatase [Aneurinibacillus aneurinilyticus]MED0709566.1 alkaline phosphatase [Aneurinibacillus aneurinilyticus]MED0725257.1 alkaline phosphatase [Aneurinibacillus aneurinilyticus]MED0735062.1 alkaline phosphatase [Aneurinibacillus aneurinilyticus]MED0739923.1 alkaline phosphatase [Aneurinibacillus aneurinilyticus]
MSKLSKKILPFAVVTSLAATAIASAITPNPAKAEQDEDKGKVKNVIFLIGDGMGQSYTTAYRYLKDDPSTPIMEKTEFDKYLVGTQMTYPEDEHENITDSASAATAMSAGVKTYNAAIAVDNDHAEVKTVLEQAKEVGKSTGLVATSEITHATPAAFGAHNISRKNMDAIADDYYDKMISGKHKVDVLLGGGTNNFVRKDRNIVEQFKKDGYSYVTDREGLLKDNNNQILGLFAPGGLDKAIDRTEKTPSLEEMTNAAINRLSKNKDGFFLMVEGSQIDWAGHDNDIVGAMSEMQDFEKAFKAAIDFAKKDGHTLVIATADHSTGGLSVGANGKYNFDANPIKAAKRTPDFISHEIVAGANVEETLKKYITLQLTDKEIQSVKDAAVSKDQGKISNAIKVIFDVRSNAGWTTGGHTGEDVPVYAYGPGKEMFSGLIDNTDNAKNIFKILKGKKEEE